MYVILLSTGTSISECYAGYAKSRERAEAFAARCGGGATVHETTREGIARIERTVALEAEYLETLRTGLGRGTRGTK